MGLFVNRYTYSPKVYAKFLRDMRPAEEMALDTVHFKNKDFGWNRFSTKLTFQDGSVYHKDRNEDFYMRGYLRYNLYLRPSCHQCQYKTLPRISDVSLGDFWGIGTYDRNLDNEQGTSVILVNSEKGRRLLTMARQELVLHERKLEEVIAGNSCLLNVAKPGKYREFFFKKMDQYPFGELIMMIDQKATKASFGSLLRQKLGMIKRRFLRTK